MFKKSLLALALAAASTSAFAVDTRATALNVSVEGQAADTTATKNAAPAITLNVEAEYTQGDTVTLTLANGEFADTNFRLVRTDTTAGKKDITFGLLNATKTELSFRVTAVGTTGTTAGTVYTLYKDATGTVSPDITLPDLSVGQKTTITTVAKTSTGIVIDTAKGKTGTVDNTDSADLFVGKAQFSATTTKSNATVDVAELRKAFTKSNNVEQLPTPDFTVTDNSDNTWVAAIADDNYTVKLTGDLSGVSGVATTGITSTLTIAKDKMSAEFTPSTAAAISSGTKATFAFTLPAADKREALTAPQDLKLTVTVKKGTTWSKNVIDNVAVSSWGLNGDVANIDFLPFQDAYARAVTVTNNGTVEGDIHAEIFANGKMVASAKVGTATKYAVTDISAALNKLAADNGVTGYAGVRVTTNAPDGNIQVNAIYYSKDDKDRVKTN
jgi:hypothetical protein